MLPWSSRPARSTWRCCAASRPAACSCRSMRRCARACCAPQATVRHIVENDQVVYGVNTGFGKLAQHAHRARPTWPSCSATWCCRTASARASRWPRRGAPGARDQGREPGARPFGRAAGAWSTRCSRCSTPASCRAFRPRARSAPRATSRRWRTWRCVLIGEGEARSPTASVVPARRGAARAPASRRSCSGPRKAWRCSTARRSRPRWRCTACSAPSTCSPRRWSRARCRSTPRSGSDTPFDARIHARARPAGPDRRRAAATAQLLDGQRDPRRRTSTATTACRIRTACAASRR